MEFGVQHGYSAVALSNYFGTVLAVDTCEGDEYAGTYPNIYEEVRRNLEPFENVRFFRSSWQQWAEDHPYARYDLIHVDIYHTWEQTYACGLWSAEHSPCVLFHDTLAFPAVGLAVGHLATVTGRTFYNWPYKHGLGILV